MQPSSAAQRIIIGCYAKSDTAVAALDRCRLVEPVNTALTPLVVLVGIMQHLESHWPISCDHSGSTSQLTTAGQLSGLASSSSSGGCGRKDITMQMWASMIAQALKAMEGIINIHTNEPNHDQHQLTCNCYLVVTQAAIEQQTLAHVEQAPTYEAVCWLAACKA